MAYSALHIDKPPRGPRSVLCVVVVTKSATGTGLSCRPGRDQAGVVRHVDEQLRAAIAGDLGELVVRNLARIGARPGHDHLRLVLAGERRHLVEVDAVVSRVTP